MGWSEAEAVYAIQSVRKDAGHPVLMYSSMDNAGFMLNVPFRTSSDLMTIRIESLKRPKLTFGNFTVILKNIAAIPMKKGKRL